MSIERHPDYYKPERPKQDGNKVHRGHGRNAGSRFDKRLVRTARLKKLALKRKWEDAA